MLLSLVALNTFPALTKLEEVKDVNVYIWIQSRGKCSTENTAVQVRDALGKIRLSHLSITNFRSNIMIKKFRNQKKWKLGLEEE